MTEPPKDLEYLLTAKGLAELDKYFIEHKDSIIKIAWYNLKDTAIRPLPEHDKQVREKVLDELDKECEIAARGWCDNDSYRDPFNDVRVWIETLRQGDKIW